MKKNLQLLALGAGLIFASTAQATGFMESIKADFWEVVDPVVVLGERMESSDFKSKAVPEEVKLLDDKSNQAEFEKYEKDLAEVKAENRKRFAKRIPHNLAIAAIVTSPVTAAATVYAGFKAVKAIIAKIKAKKAEVANPELAA